MSVSPALVEQLSWELRRSFRELAAAADRDLSRLGITVSDRALLEFLAKERGPVTLSELARRRSVSRQHIHQSLRRLPEPAWVTARPDPEDRRSLLLRLSPRGRAFWRKVRAADAAFFARIATRLPKREVRSAVEALRHLRDVLGAGEEARGE
jgi:DNA-binding MarR family transcriptional regulator